MTTKTPSDEPNMIHMIRRRRRYRIPPVYLGECLTVLLFARGVTGVPRYPASATIVLISR